MKTNLNLLVVICLLIITFSCNDDTNSFEYPTTYISRSVSEMNIKVYTNSGEITNRLIKDEFIKRYKDYLMELDKIEIEGELTATYISSNTVELSKKDLATSEIRTVHDLSGLIYWEKPEIYNIVGSPQLDFLIKYFSYHPLFMEEDTPIVSPSGPNSTTFRLKECFYVKKKNNYLIMPYLDFYFKNAYQQFSVRRFNNKFNSDSISSLGVNDTIMIQEYNIEIKINSKV